MMAILHDTMADFSNNPSKSIPSVVKITIMYCCKCGHPTRVRTGDTWADLWSTTCHNPKCLWNHRFCFGCKSITELFVREGEQVEFWKASLGPHWTFAAITI